MKKLLLFILFPPFILFTQMVIGISISAILFFGLSGCGPSKAEIEKIAMEAVLNTQDSTIITNDKSQIKVDRILQIIKPDGKGGGTLRFITVDGHEYIQWYTAGDGSSYIAVSMCHDANCSNEKHK